MSQEFKKVWENNQDTPVNAKNLSRHSDVYAEDTPLFIDSDGRLKFRANTKLSFQERITNALFSLNHSYVSHDSKNSFLSSNSTTFRIETPEGESSLALEEGSENLLSNPSFSNAFTNWTTILSNETISSSSIDIEPSDLDDDNMVSMMVDSSGNGVFLQQSVMLPDNLQNFSVSFYYKGDAELKLQIIGDHTTSPKYWNGNTQWLSTETPIVLSSSAEWKRFEVKNIATSVFSGAPEILIKIYSNNPSAQYKLDRVQLEVKSFCTSFIEGVRLNHDSSIQTSLINLDKGLIDMSFMPKYLNSINTLFCLRTTVSSVDVLKLCFNSSNRSISFEMFDNDMGSMIRAQKLFTQNEYESLVDNWHRIVCSWNKDSGIYLFLDDSLIASALGGYEVYSSGTITHFQLGRRENFDFANGLLGSIKFNLVEKPELNILSDMSSSFYADDNISHIFSLNNNNLIVSESFLDAGTEYNSSTKYYLYLVFDSESDYSSLVISENSQKPLNTKLQNIRKIGGFETDSSGFVDPYSLWDMFTSYRNTIHSQRLMIDGKFSEKGVEIGSQPFSENTEAKFNIPVKFTDDVEFYDGTSNFLTINASGSIDIDSITIDSDTISSLGNLIIQGSILQLSASDSVDINSGSSVINVDDVIVKNNSVYVKSGSDLIIENDKSSSSIRVKTNTGNMYVSGEEVHFDSSRHYSSATSEWALDASSFSLSTSGTATIEDVVFNNGSIAIKDVGNVFHTIQKNSDGVTPGLVLRTATNPADGAPILSVKSASGESRLRVDHVGSLYTSNNSLDINGAILTKGNTSPSGSTALGYNGYFYATRVHNAVYNDLAECWIKSPDDNIRYKDVVVQTKKGIERSSKRAQKATVGVVSNTYGYLLGSEGFDEGNILESLKLPVAIAGRVYVIIHGKAEIGDQLVSYKHGKAIKANLFERIFKQERIIGQVDSEIEHIDGVAYCIIKVK